MTTSSRKFGFTLTELMITTALSTVILSGLIAVFIGSSRFVRHILVEADLAMRARDLRERLLFQAVPSEKSKGGTTCYGGLLSSRPNNYNGAVLKQSGTTWIANVPKTTSRGSGTVPIFELENVVLALTSTGLYNTSRQNSTWLKPAGHPFGWTASDFTDTNHKGNGFIDIQQFNGSKDAQGNKNANYWINLRYSLGDMTRVERLHIPICGVQQRTYTDGKTFHDSEINK